MLSQRLLVRSGSLLLAGGATVAMSAPIQAEENIKSKLPIYSSPSEPVQVVETHTELERHVGDARRFLSSSTENLRQSVHKTVSQWIDIEKKVEKQVLNIVPQDEPLNPGALYVGIATLTGSVVGRYRSFPIRILCPPLFLLTSLNYFLPQTAHNLSLYYQQIESAHLPPSVQAHRQAIVDKTRSLWKQGEESAKSGVRQVEGGVKGGLKKVEEQTGLKIGQKE